MAVNRERRDKPKGNLLQGNAENEAQSFLRRKTSHENC